MPNTAPVPALMSGRWPWLLGAGLVLTIIGFIVWALTQETLSEGDYVPPRFVDGEIVPGHIATPE